VLTTRLRVRHGPALFRASAPPAFGDLPPPARHRGFRCCDSPGPSCRSNRLLSSARSTSRPRSDIFWRGLRSRPRRDRRQARRQPL